MRGRDFLIVADRLQAEHAEPFDRTAIGRAYYSAFLEARRFCEQHLGYVNAKTAHEHRDVRALMQRAAPQLDDKLFFLRRYRNTADYDLDVDPGTIAVNTEHALFLAREIIDHLDRLAEAAADSAPGTREGWRNDPQEP